MSRIGRKPISIPEGVKININPQRRIEVEGPKGKLMRIFPETIELEVKDNHIWVKRKENTKKAKALHGLWRQLIFNMIEGVT
ncbi:MAG: 50S ribosomal protein L6, partial [Candidatus Omnitrophica bacterium]|nr:50S ribosomal protein L6 [Candidatus Omnitrophota bacterium]